MSFCCSAVYSCEELKPVVKSVLGNTLTSCKILDRMDSY